MKEKSITKLCKSIFSLEKKYNMLEKEIQGVPVWQTMRTEIFYKLAQDNDIYSTPHSSLSKKDLIKSAPKVLFNSVLNNPLNRKRIVDSFIFMHQRKTVINDKYIDIYTKYFSDTLDNDNYELLEYSYKGKNIKKKSRNHMFLDVLTLRRMLQSKSGNFTNEELEYINNLQNAFKEEFGVKYDFLTLFSNRILKYNNEYSYYDKLFKKRKPKVIYVVVAYSHHALIAAAKNNSVKTVELQHGVISRFHLGYNYPNCKKEIKCFPDELYVFGEYWKHAADYPISQDRMTSIGFKYFLNNMSEYSDIKRNEKQILFISQGAIGKRLSEYVYKLAKELPNYNIVYKLHPGEYSRWRSEYSELIKAAKLNNVKIVDTNEKTLYHYFAESNYQVGVFSTAIYEGMAFGCKTVLVDLPGIEYMEDLIGKKYALLAKDSEQLKSVILDIDNKEFNNITSEILFG